MRFLCQFWLTSAWSHSVLIMIQQYGWVGFNSRNVLLHVEAFKNEVLTDHQSRGRLSIKYCPICYWCGTKSNFRYSMNISRGHFNEILVLFVLVCIHFVHPIQIWQTEFKTWKNFEFECECSNIISVILAKFSFLLVWKKQWSNLWSKYLNI